jgi:SAM-dependent methyltransferase
MNNFAASTLYYDTILGKKKFENYANFLSKLLHNYNIKSVLELGCGSGLYLSPLKKNGFSVEGLDISKKMLVLAKKLNVPLYCRDMASFRLRKKYDAIICMNSSLVLLPNFTLIEKTLKNCYSHLNSKGILVLDLPNHAVEIKENNFSQDVDTYKIPKGKLNIIFRDYKLNNKWVSEWFGFIKQKNSFSNFHEFYEELIYSSVNLEKTLQKIGFEILHIFGSRNGGKFLKTNSYRRFYVCKKCE